MAEQENPMRKIITRCWDDEAFKERLLADPAATLRAEGVQISEGVTVNVVIDTEDVQTLVIPAPERALSDAEIAAVASGGSCIRSLSQSMDTICRDTRSCVGSRSLVKDVCDYGCYDLVCWDQPI